jgi:hypothetical protein
MNSRFWSIARPSFGPTVTRQSIVAVELILVLVASVVNA